MIETYLTIAGSFTAGVIVASLFCMSGAADDLDLVNECERLTRARNAATAAAFDALDSQARLSDVLHAKTARLEHIVAMETPNCAHVGKRMAAVARGEA